MAMFRALSQNDIPVLANLGELFHRQENLSAALLCLDRVFAHISSLESASLSEIVAYFQRFLIYARILQRLSCDPDPCGNQHIRRLFAFRTANGDSEELFVLPKGCYLYGRVHPGTPAEVEGVADKRIHHDIRRWDLERLIKEELRERLKKKVWDQNEISHNLLRLRPCLLFAASGFCPRRECPQLHIHESPADAGTIYSHLVHVHVLQIMIFHTLYATDITYYELVRQQRSVFSRKHTTRHLQCSFRTDRAWLRRLYEALYPIYHAVGSLHILSVEVV